MKVLLAFLGRLMFPLGSKDDWQLVPCFFGTADSGKSLLTEAIQTFFNAEDISAMSNTTERGFGISNHW